ncbi:MAG: hypothetical protein Kow0025_01670 [Thermodesulfovibrionales bacterium]
MVSKKTLRGDEAGRASTRETGALLKRIRKASGLSQVKVAEMMGVSYQQVQKYEKGTSELTVSRLRQFSAIFGMPASILLGEREGPGFLCEDEREAITLFRRIKNARMRRVALEILWLLVENEKGAGRARSGSAAA